MINYLITEGFKKLGSKEFRFEDGSNILCGENGAGKSTVFKAIRFALFGVAASGSQRDTLPTYGLKNCKVELGIGDLRIVRDLKNCTIFKGEQIEAEGNTACTAYIEDYLGMDFKAFNIFCLSPQGETQALLSIGATEINRRVEQYSGVLLIDCIIANANQDIKVLSKQLDEMTKFDLSKLEFSIIGLRDNMENVQMNCSRLSSEKGVADQLHSSAQEDLTNARLDNNKITQARSNVQEAKEAVAALELERSDNEKITRELKETDLDHDELSSQLKGEECALNAKLASNAEYEKLKQDFNRLKLSVEELQELADQEFQSQTNIRALDTSISRLESDLSKEKEKLYNKRSEMYTVESQLKNGVCPTCQRAHENFDVDEANEKYLKLHSEEQALSGYTSFVEGQLSTAKQQLRAEQSSVGGYKEKLEKANAQFSDVQLKMSMAKQYPKVQIEKAQERVLTLSTDIRLIKDRRNQLEQAKEQEIRILRKIDAQKSKLAKYSVDAARDYHDIDVLEQKVTTAKEALNSVSSTLRQAEIDAVQFKNDLGHAEYELKQAKEVNEKYDQLAKDLGVRMDLVKLIRDKRQSFMSEIWFNILTRASVFVSQTTDGWISEILRDEKGNFSYREEGKHAVPIIGNASGAQAAFCGAALRIGISQALYGKNSLLMLDEPTESMTENNAARLASGLLNLGGQILLITHRKSEAYTAQNVIEIA